MGSLQYWVIGYVSEEEGSNVFADKASGIEKLIKIAHLCEAAVQNQFSCVMITYCSLYLGQAWYRIFSFIRRRVFLPKQSKNLDPSYKTDLDLLVACCFVVLRPRGGGGQRVCCPPPLKLLGGGPGPPLYLRLWVTESNDTCILASYISN